MGLDRGVCQVLGCYEYAAFVTEARVGPTVGEFRLCVAHGRDVGRVVQVREAPAAKPVLPTNVEERLAKIRDAHGKNTDQHGGTDGYCNECGWLWPCPTRRWSDPELTTDEQVGAEPWDNHQR